VATWLRQEDCGPAAVAKDNIMYYYINVIIAGGVKKKIIIYKSPLLPQRSPRPFPRRRRP